MMKAMVLRQLRQPLSPEELPDPVAGPGEVCVAVEACAVCRTDLHVVDGDLPNPMLPVVPGHEIVGRAQSLGGGVDHLAIGQHVGISWLGHTCGHCAYCMSGHENLCDEPLFMGEELEFESAKRSNYINMLGRDRKSQSPALSFLQRA